VEFLLATLIYPVLLAVLATGAGLLVDRVVGPLPGALLPVTGLALLIATVSLTTYWGGTAPLAPVAAVAVALAGAAAGWRRLRAADPDWWLVAASAAVYIAVCAPVLLAGRVTEAAYLLDTTAAFQVLGGDYIVGHARDFSALPASTLRQTLENYFGTQYPAGGQVLLATGAKLVDVRSLWLYQPFLALMVAFCVAPLATLARAASLPRSWAAVAGGVAAMPALVYAYAQTGSIKELTALPFVLLLGALLVQRPPLAARGPRGAVLAALAGAAGVAAIGIAFAAWLGAVVGAGVVLALLTTARPLRVAPRQVAIWGAVFGAALLVLALPTLGPLSESLSLAKSLSTSNAAAVADPGNLLRPLLLVQVAGVWLGGSYRVDPEYLGPTYFLIGLMTVGALFGLLLLVRRRLWAVLAFIAALALVWLVLTRRGTTWTDAKMLMMTSPVFVLLAAIGVRCIFDARRRVEALALGAVLAFGVLASGALLYHETNLMPTERYEELLSIGDRFAGADATLVPEFDEFALYALDEMGPSGPGFSSKPPELATLSDGSGTLYGGSYDVGQLDWRAVQEYPFVVLRRRPDTSRPPSGYRLAFRGAYYDVWRRSADAPTVVGYEPGGGGAQPAGVVACSEIGRLAARARRRGGSLRYAPRPAVVALDPADARRLPAAWAPLEEGVALGSPGRVSMRFEAPEAGRYRIWLKGDFARAVAVSVDGRRVGEAAYQSGNAGNYARPFDVRLSAGRHVLTLERGGGGLAPGDGGPSRLSAIVLEPYRAGPPTVLEVSSDDWRRLCGRRVDWIEAVAS